MMDGLLESCFTAVSLWAKKESLLRANWYPNKKTLGPRPPQFLLFVQGVCHLQFLFLIFNFKNNYRGSFFFQNPQSQRSACSSLPRRGKKKEPNNVLYLLCGFNSSH